jgi:hypothetical protein
MNKIKRKNILFIQKFNSFNLKIIKNNADLP